MSRAPELQTEELAPLNPLVDAVLVSKAQVLLPLIAVAVEHRSLAGVAGGRLTFRNPSPAGLESFQLPT